MSEESALPDLKIPNTDIQVKPDGYPSLTDGNLKPNMYFSVL